MIGRDNFLVGRMLSVTHISSTRIMSQGIPRGGRETVFVSWVHCHLRSCRVSIIKEGTMDTGEANGSLCHWPLGHYL